MATNEVKLPFAQNPDGRMVHISEVPNGLACDCICPKCQTSLVAKKGKKMQHHFAHEGRGSCKGAVESALHKAAKQVLAEGHVIHLPEYWCTIQGFGNQKLFNEIVWEYQKVAQEQQIKECGEHVVADVVLKDGKRKLIIEIAVTHPIDEEKAGKIRKMNLSVVEIDLKQHLDTIHNFDDLKKILIDKLHNKTWIHSSKKEELILKKRQELITELKSHRNLLKTPVIPNKSPKNKK
ncbi:competence protein CoiA family protein [uncultured Microscilla sp.]|uniref:competence protein CoiA family protein n=1 Tax=uncultured Microscilla sp. TaxID=432653 RepID=UPI002608A32D|nr:competence protein CoiA family protein [uncultured Microscilla sp.]